MIAHEDAHAALLERAESVFVGAIVSDVNRANPAEDAFRALEERGIGILVSEQSQSTAATYSLKDPAEVECFLRGLTATLT